MLQQLWSYFEATGDVTMYLGFKEYENERNSKLQMPNDAMNKDEVG